MKKLIYIILVLLALQNGVSAETLTNSFSGSLTANNTNNHEVVFSKAGTLTVRYTTTSSSGVIVAILMRSGVSFASKSASTQTTVTFDPVQVWPNETYTLRMFCPYGSNAYTASLTMVCDTNSDPVITSMTASPDSAEYGEPISVSVVATDPDNNLSYIRLEKDSIGVTSNASPLVHAYEHLPVGSHTVTAYAFDAQSASDAESISFSVTRRPITVRAIGGRSLYGSAPVNQGIQLVSGTLVNGDTLSSIGLSASSQISSSTPVGSYSIGVSGEPSNYSVCSVTGTWFVVEANAFGIIDSDGDGIDDRLEATVYGGTENGFGSFFSDSDGDGYMDFLDTTTAYSSSNTPSSRMPGGQGGPLIILPDRGIYEVTANTFTLNSR